jgi:hypothetical protein
VPAKPAHFRWGHWGHWGHRANIEFFDIHRLGTGGDIWGQIAGTCTSRSGAGASLSPFVPTSDWDLGAPKPASLLVSPMSPVSPRIFSSLHEGCEIEPHSASGKIKALLSGIGEMRPGSLTQQFKDR